MHWIDPAGLPDIAGTPERLLANPHGEADGILLTDGTLVHVPPHLSAALRAAVVPGAAVRVRGIRPRGAPHMVSAVSIQTEDGSEIRDDGPPETKPHREAPARSKVAVNGVVRLSLHGPKGELRGALLEDGTVLRVPPKDAARLASLLQPGARLAARGEGIDTPEGRVIAAKAIGANAESLPALEGGKPKKQPKKAKHDRGAHDDAGRGEAVPA